MTSRGENMLVAYSSTERSSSVERSVWDREVQGSIPCAPTE